MILDEDQLYGELLIQSEDARWSESEIQWQDIDHSVVDDLLVSSVRAAVASECTTLSATQQFLEHFYDDVEFTEWVSIWFYEETRHPHTLRKWLSKVGVTIPSTEILAARQISPMHSNPIATLTINVIAEAQAADGYLALTDYSREPVLAGIARRLAGDEARHGGHFLAFLGERVGSGRDLWDDQKSALKALYLWLQDRNRVLHPGNKTLTAGLGDGAGWESSDGLEERVTEAVCTALGFSGIRTQSDVSTCLREGTRRARSA